MAKSSGAEIIVPLVGGAVVIAAVVGAAVIYFSSQIRGAFASWTESQAVINKPTPFWDTVNSLAGQLAGAGKAMAGIPL